MARSQMGFTGQEGSVAAARRVEHPEKFPGGGEDWEWHQRMDATWVTYKIRNKRGDSGMIWIREGERNRLRVFRNNK